MNVRKIVSAKIRLQHVFSRLVLEMLETALVNLTGQRQNENRRPKVRSKKVFLTGK